MDCDGIMVVCEFSFDYLMSDVIFIILCIWMCVVCGFLYSEVEGLLEEGIVLGMCWEDIFEIWICLDCGVIKVDFEMVEVD